MNKFLLKIKKYKFLKKYNLLILIKNKNQHKYNRIEMNKKIKIKNKVQK